MSTYYEILGVSKSTALDELKKADRKAALKNHPDKGGDPDKFLELREAYEALTDLKRREIYDEEKSEDASGKGLGGGVWASKQSMGGGIWVSKQRMDDRIWISKISKLFFEIDGGGGRRGRPQRRGEDSVHYLNVSLEDLYNGMSRKLSLLRNIICFKCKGTGSKIRASKSSCSDCQGQKVVQIQRWLEVHIEKGMQHGQKITLHGESDEAPDTHTGDLHFILQLKKHSKFKRQGDDLFVEHTLTMTEAVHGFQFPLTHLDGRELLIKSSPGEIIQPGQFKIINDEGMPRCRRPFLKGRMYIHFTVRF